MKSFKEFNIVITTKSFVGDKIKIDRVLNREIIIYEFKVVASKYEGDRLDMQIGVGETKHVLWTSSKVLKEQIEKVPPENFPFKATIIKENERYQFT